MSPGEGVAASGTAPRIPLGMTGYRVGQGARARLLLSSDSPRGGSGLQSGLGSSRHDNLARSTS